MRYIDMHCDTLGSALAQKTETFLELDHTMVDGLRLQQAEAGAQFFAMFLPQRNDPDWFGLEEMPPAEALMRKMYAIFRHTMEQCSDRFAAAHNAEELKLAEEDQRPPLLLPHFSVHSLRHTFCTRMFEVESNHKAIQTIMGHAEISTTLDIYTHITEDTLENSVQNMSAKIKLFG